MKKVLILSNLISYTYSFRKEIIEALVQQGYAVTIVADFDDDKKEAYFRKLGCKTIDVPFHGKGTSIKQDLKVLCGYIRTIFQTKPDMVFTYTIKPNLYGGIASRLLGKNYVPMITGLGEVEKPGKLQKLLLAMHRFVMPHAVCVLFQNTENMAFFDVHKIRTKKKLLVPGSGINLSEHTYEEYPEESEGVSFGFVGRLTVAKGIEQFLDAAEHLKAKDNGLHFHVAGKCDDQFRERVETLNAQNVIEYHGLLSDTKELYRKIHCLVLPTYHPEGISNVLLESAACGRPAICTSRAGCREVVQNGVNGMYCEAKDSGNLISVMEKFLKLDWNEKRQMGLSGRKIVEEKFSRDLIVERYLMIMEENI